MAGTDQLLLAIWQCVSRHLEIVESTHSTADLLAGHVPLKMLAICRLEEEQHQIRTAAHWPRVEGGAELSILQLSETDVRQLKRMTRQPAVVRKGDNGKDVQILLNLLPHFSRYHDWVLASLHGEHGSRGFLWAAPNVGQKFSRQHVNLLATVQEPMAVALDNDARLHELDTFRQAFEADRQSLLRRLGRREAGDTIVGEQTGLSQVMARVDLVSRSEVPVLILGETGTGKELVARAIHNRSDRHQGPFIRVNCGAIPRELIDSQLFGHERGSFTGANEMRQGWFERADTGTLFLDEIGELPLDAQVRFLRVLQDGFVERVGGTKSIRVNVRVVAATHRDLANMVKENSFREDLWYRIAVFPILLPPLRERRGDIPALAQHFAERAAIRFGLAPVVPGQADIELLQNYDWPGNIRELGAVIDRAAILGNGQSLEIAAALGLTMPRAPDATVVDTDTQAFRLRSGRIAPLNEATRVHIEAALRATHGRIEGPRGAARILQINPHTLRARMRKLKIDWSAFRQPADDDVQ
jgi:transcriptional regulator with GAF, ATPase, and Fis domain